MTFTLPNIVKDSVYEKESKKLVLFNRKLTDEEKENLKTDKNAEEEDQNAET